MRRLLTGAGAALRAGLRALFALPLGRPALSAGLVLVLSLGFGLATARWLRLDVREEKIFPEHDARRVVYDRFKALFGPDDATALCALELPPGTSVLSTAGLARIDSLTRALKDEPLVDARRLVSLSNATFVRVPDAETLEVGPLWEPRRAASWDEARMGALLAAHPLYARRLLSDDHRIATFLIPLAPGQRSPENLKAFVTRLRTFFSPTPGGVLRPGETAHLEGFAVTNDTVLGLIRSDLGRFVPLSFAAVLLGLGVVFRRLLPALLGVVLMALAVTWTLGSMALLSIPVSFVSSVIPVVILVVCVGDAVHLLARYRARLSRGQPQADALRDALDEVGAACFYTSATTAAGFASLVGSQVEIVRELGIPLALGTVAAWLITVLLLPPLLLWAPPLPAPLEGPAVGRRRLLGGLADLLARRGGRVALIWLALGLGALALLPRLSRETRLLEAFDADHPLIQTRRLFEQRMGGVAPLEVLIESPTPGRVLDPDVLRALHRLGDQLRGERFRALGLLHVCSLADLIADAQWTFDARDPALRGRLPDSRAGAAQLRFVYGMGERDPTRDYVDGADDPTALRLQLRIENLYTSQLRTLEDEVERAARAALPSDLSLALTGKALMFQDNVETLVQGMLSSLGLAAVSVGLLIACAAGSLRLALLALVPNALPILLVFGVMVLTGTALNLSTSVICTIMLGIAVDDTIHFLAAHQERRARGEPDPVRATLIETGSSLALTSALLVVGFSVLLASNFPANRTFGALLAVTVGLALLADLTLLPVLLRWAGDGPRDVTGPDSGQLPAA